MGNLFLGNKKALPLSCFNLLSWGHGGKGERRNRHERRVAVDSSKIFWILFAVVQAVITNSVATSACLTEFFIYGVTCFLASFFYCISRNEKTSGN